MTFHKTSNKKEKKKRNALESVHQHSLLPAHTDAHVICPVYWHEWALRQFMIDKYPFKQTLPVAICTGRVVLLLKMFVLSHSAWTVKRISLFKSTFLTCAVKFVLDPLARGWKTEDLITWSLIYIKCFYSLTWIFCKVNSKNPKVTYRDWWNRYSHTCHYKVYPLKPAYI